MGWWDLGGLYKRCGISCSKPRSNHEPPRTTTNSFLIYERCFARLARETNFRAALQQICAADFPTNSVTAGAVRRYLEARARRLLLFLLVHPIRALEHLNHHKETCSSRAFSFAAHSPVASSVCDIGGGGEVGLYSGLGFAGVLNCLIPVFFGFFFSRPRLSRLPMTCSFLLT